MQFRILGPLEVEDDGRPLALAGPKQRALLASLLLRVNQTVSRDRLIHELWGERAPETAGHRLEEHVSRLRKLLHRNGERPIATRSGGYMLRLADDALDASRFERLAREGNHALRDGRLEQAVELLDEALRLWRGAPLEDVAHNDAVAPELRQLEEQRAVAHEQLIEAELAGGRHVEVLSELERLIEQEPLRERLRLLLMLALYRSGRQADALAAYRDMRQALTEELGIEPGPALKDLEQAILRQDASLELFDPNGRPLRPVPRATAGNLPRPMTSLVGRAQEIADVVGLLEGGARLVTLTGPGGTGKTRLALEVANRAAATFPSGVFWVELASIRDSQLVMTTIARALGARGEIGDHIGDIRLLLVIDNLEHVLESAAELGALVKKCPNLHVLVTSRARLRVSAGTDYEVSPLKDSEAIELFSVRSRAEPDEVIAELCRRLDNLPLAIEFAAARATVLGPSEILERISRRLDLLEGPRDAEAHQETLRATIAWSHELLSTEEQRLFARLAVFDGGWTLEAAESVADADLETLESLVGSSIVQNTAGRFSILETTREFAQERLKESREADAIRDRHMTYFTNLVESLEPGLWTSDAARCNAMLLAELANVRASLKRARERRNATILTRVAAGLAPLFWVTNGVHEEGRSWLEEALAIGEGHATAARMRCHFGLTLIAELEGELETGRMHASHMLAIARERHDSTGIFFALLNLGVLAEDLDDSESFFEQSACVARQAGSEQQLAFVATNRAGSHLSAGSYERALSFADEAAQMWTRLGIPLIRAAALTLAGSAARELGRLDVAADRLGAALRLCCELSIVGVTQLGAFAALEIQKGRMERAARLAGASQALCERGFAFFEPFERSVYEQTVAVLQRTLDARTLAAAMAEGRVWPLDEAVAHALEDATL